MEQEIASDKEILELTNYGSAVRALAMATKVDDVLNVRNHAEAMRLYAKQAKNQDLEVQASEIRLRAERRLGEMLILQKQEFGFNKGGRPAKDEEPEIPSLPEMGIDHHLSSRAQKIAQVSEEDFNDVVEEHKIKVKQERERVINKLVRHSDKDELDRVMEENKALGKEIEDLKEKLLEMSDEMALMTAEIESISKIMDSHDKLKEAALEMKKTRDLNKVLERRVAGLLIEGQELKRTVRYWMNKVKHGS